MEGRYPKNAAWFDHRHEFDSLRVSFLHAACGKRLERLQDLLGECLDSGEILDPDATESVLRYLDECCDHFGVAPSVSCSPAFFADEAWPLLVECICDQQRQYYLSVDELLLVCELCHQNVAVFRNTR